MLNRCIMGHLVAFLNEKRTLSKKLKQTKNTEIKWFLFFSASIFSLTPPRLWMHLFFVSAYFILKLTFSFEVFLKIFILLKNRHFFNNTMRFIATTYLNEHSKWKQKTPNVNFQYLIKSYTMPVCKEQKWNLLLQMKAR